MRPEADLGTAIRRLGNNRPPAPHRNPAKNAVDSADLTVADIISRFISMH